MKCYIQLFGEEIRIVFCDFQSIKIDFISSDFFEPCGKFGEELSALPSDLFIRYL